MIKVHLSFCLVLAAGGLPVFSMAGKANVHRGEPNDIFLICHTPVPSNERHILSIDPQYTGRHLEGPLRLPRAL